MSELVEDIAGLADDFRKKARLASATAENYTFDAFKNSRWDKVDWKERKSKNKEDRRNPNKRALLIGSTRRLRSSIRVQLVGNEIHIYTDSKYGKIHNEGGIIDHPGGTPYIIRMRKSRGRHKFSKGMAIFVSKSRAAGLIGRVKYTKPHKIEIPRRQFMGNSRELIAMIDRIFEKS